jgi:glycosyltransferase involved in cell wall biosynthesis
MSGLLNVVFWGSVAIVVYALVGWPTLLALRALFPAPAPRISGGALPFVSYLIVAHNERAEVDAKLANTAELDYPDDRLEVIFASDGSDDGTNARVAELWRSANGGPRRRLLPLPRVGKNAALNAAAAAASGEILVFSDADSHLAPDAIRRLVAPLGDPAIGATGGDYRYAGRGVEGERAYWTFDRLWKRLESRAGSMTSATGQIYAIRAELFEPVPDGVTDDFFVSTGAIASGKRLWFARDAIASGPIASSSRAEFHRKVRVASRGLASVWERRSLLDPRRHGFYAVQLFTHKVLRRALGIPVATAFASATALGMVDPYYAAAAVAQALVHAAAFAGWCLQGRFKSRILALPVYLDLALAAGVLALVDTARGRRHRDWVPERRRAESLSLQREAR